MFLIKRKWKQKTMEKHKNRKKIKKIINRKTTDKQKPNRKNGQTTEKMDNERKEKTRWRKDTKQTHIYRYIYRFIIYSFFPISVKIRI